MRKKAITKIKQMEQFDDFFPTQAIAGPDATVPIKLQSPMPARFKWILVGVGIVLVLGIFYFLFSNKKASVLTAKDIEQKPLLQLPSYAELGESVTLEPKSVSAQPVKIAPVQAVAEIQHPKDAVQEVQKPEPVDPIRAVGLGLKDVLLANNVKPEHVTSIVTHAVKTLLQDKQQDVSTKQQSENKESLEQKKRAQELDRQRSAQLEQQQRQSLEQQRVTEQQRLEKVKRGGKLVIGGRALPMELHAQDDEYESVPAGTKESKINAESNPAILALMKSRGLTVKS